MKQKGFTMVELLIYMGLLGILLLVITDMFVTTIAVRESSESNINLENDGRFILSRLSYDIRRATTITTPTAGTTTQNLILSASVPYQYSINSNNLQLNVNNGAEIVQLNSNSVQVTNLNFQRLGTGGGLDTIKITFTLKSNNPQLPVSDQTRSYQTTVGMRCYTGC